MLGDSELGCPGRSEILASAQWPIHDIIQEPGRDEDQNAGRQGNDWLEMSNSEGHAHITLQIDQKGSAFNMAIQVRPNQSEARSLNQLAARARRMTSPAQWPKRSLG